MTLTCSEEEQEIVFTDAPKPSQDESRDDEGHDRAHTISKVKKNKVVAFEPHVEARIIERRKTLSKEVRNELWYSQEELVKIRGYTRTTLCLMNTKTDIPADFHDRFCTRGLEGRTRKALKHRAKLRNKVWNAVFDEQDIQEEERVRDPMAIAEVASSASLAAIKEAHDTALRDEREARQCSKSDEETVLTLKSTMQLSLLKPIEFCRWTLW